MFQKIIDSHFAEPCLIVLNNNEQPVTENKTLASKIANNRGRIFHLAIRKLLELVYDNLIERDTYLPDANQTQSCEHLFTQTPNIRNTEIRFRHFGAHWI